MVDASQWNDWASDPIARPSPSSSFIINFTWPGVSPKGWSISVARPNWAMEHSAMSRHTSAARARLPRG